MDYKLSWIDKDNSLVTMPYGNEMKPVAVLHQPSWTLVALLTGANITPWYEGEVTDIVSATKLISKLSDTLFINDALAKDHAGVISVTTNAGFNLFLSRACSIDGFYLTSNMERALLLTMSHAEMMLPAFYERLALPLPGDSIKSVLFLAVEMSVIDKISLQFS